MKVHRLKSNLHPIQMKKNSIDNLSEESKEHIRASYATDKPRGVIQKRLAQSYGVSERTVRKWALDLHITGPEALKEAKIMTYDIETSLIRANVWWSGKQYVRHNQLLDETKIISVSWRWLGEEKVHALHWDLKKNCDKKLMVEFLKEYNQADMVIGQNNNSFDNKIINTRAMKFNLDVNVHVKSFDIMREAKRLCRLPSYSMGYMCKYFGVENKLTHEGRVMWEMIQYGTKEERKEYISKMIDYNVGDIVSTEALYIRLRKYMGHKMHFGVLSGKPRYTSPSDGTDDIRLIGATSSATGTITYTMKSNTDGVQFKLNHKWYQEWLCR